MYNTLVHLIKMAESTVVKVRRNGVVTIPDNIRDVLHINEGDYVRLVVEKVEKEKAQAQE